MVSVDERLDRLERSLRRWRIVAGIALVAALTSAASAVALARPQDEVRAKSFVIMGGSGQAVGRLGEVKDKGPLLVLESKSAHAKIMVGSMGEDAGLAVVADDGANASVMVGANGGPGIAVCGPGRSKLMAGYATGLGPVLAVIDEKGEARVSISERGVKSTPGTDAAAATP
ncbi:MAG TPA: hypothetical protein VEM76_04000 [Anaeromyxobacteraceae bacterium]|nr:hypothetical protein [Anaeromyxobacteraceae bacterium]